MHGKTPIMQYKEHPKISNWMPRERGIELWKKDANGNPLLPIGSPNVLPLASFVKDHELVISGINSYMLFLPKNTNKKLKRCVMILQACDPLVDKCG